MEEKNGGYKSEIKKCYFDISKILKELFDLKRENRFRWIVEQEYELGNKSLIYKNDFGIKKNNEYWNDGILFKDIKKKLNLNKAKIDLLKKVKNDENTFLNSFNLNLLIKEKNDLNEELIKLKRQKHSFSYFKYIYEQEKISRFSPFKKDGLPLLNDRYQILELIGKGGYSEVYKTYDLQNHSFVVCKLLQINQKWPDDVQSNYIRHTVRENTILKTLNHDNIVKLIDTISIDDFSFCNILEYCQGPDLGLYLRQNGPLSEEFSRIIIYQLLNALKYLNDLDEKIIHYDLKPENIIFVSDVKIKITDFGLSKKIDSNKDYI